MKNLFSSLTVLLGLAVAMPGHAQSVTLDELIRLRPQDAVAVNSYLAARGWKLSDYPADDSTRSACWVYLDRAKHTVGQVLLTYQEGKPTLITFATTQRPAFEAVRAKVAAYDMESQGTAVSKGDGSVWTKYYGATYEVQLHVFTPPNEPATWYATHLKPHGLTRYYVEGEAEPRWGHVVLSK